VGGNLTTPCSQGGGAETCTITYLSSGSWIAGEWDISDQPSEGGVGFSEVNDQDGVEGLNDNYSPASTQFSLSSEFVNPLATAPPCSPDSYDYCVEEGTPSSSGTIFCLTTSDPPHHFNAPSQIVTPYAVYGYEGYLETASVTVNYVQSAPPCPTVSSFSWSPNDPGQTYGDPYLDPYVP
jgi:hypothetical protein